MKSRKLTVFIVIDIQLFLLFILMIFFAKDVLEVLGVHILWGLIGNAATYIGGNVMHAWQKSKYYKSEMNPEGV